MVLLALVAQIDLPGTSSVSVAFSPASVCAECHATFDPQGSPHDTWMGSAMAHAARDPWFRAAVVVAERDHPGIGDLCFRCHTPEAWLEGRCLPSDGSRLLPTDTGIGCSGCHRMDPNPYVRNAQYVVVDEARVRGPYSVTPAPHATQASTWVSDSAFCGTCHDLVNPLVPRKSQDGTVTAMPFPEQTTYSEWLASDFVSEGRTCQACHMPEEPGQNALAGPQRRERSVHAFAGGNLFLLDSVALLFPELDIQNQLQNGSLRIRQMMASAAHLELIDPPASARKGELLALTLRVVNDSGHKLPTGYPQGRRVFLSARSQALGFDRGSYDPLTDELVDPLAVYEVVHGRHGVGPTHHLALNDLVISDSRIPPRGFVATATTAPVGKEFLELQGGKLAHYDDVELAVEVPCDATEDIDLEFGLHYQSIHTAVVDELLDDTVGTPEAETLGLAFATFEQEPLPIASLRIRIPLDPLACALPDAGVPPRPDAGHSDASSADAGEALLEDQGCGCRSTSRSTSKSQPTEVAWVLLLALRLRKRAFRIGR